jgi:hypothetical protein
VEAVREEAQKPCTRTIEAEVLRVCLAGFVVKALPHLVGILAFYADLAVGESKKAAVLSRETKVCLAKTVIGSSWPGCLAPQRATAHCPGAEADARRRARPSAVDLVHPAVEKVTLVLEGIGDGKVAPAFSGVSERLPAELPPDPDRASAYWLNHDAVGVIIGLMTASYHQLVKRKPITPTDLMDVEWVLRERESGTRSVFEDALAEFGLKAGLRIALELLEHQGDFLARGKHEVY